MYDADSANPEVEIYVINLDRRPDRLERIGSTLISRNLKFNRVSAVDGSKAPVGQSELDLLTPGERAIWSSHQNALSDFLQSESEYALILEDDANLANSRISQESLSKWVSAMEKLGLSMLQVGFISHLYKLSKPRGLLDLVLALRAKRIVYQSGLDTRIALGEFRAGAHAYLVKRPLAKELVGANTPTILAADNFFESLARQDSRKRFGRLFKSAIEQESRVQGSQALDSDA
jgi:GR25 family glycosyltransferase involved in LPS biosynthesis